MNSRLRRAVVALLLLAPLWLAPAAGAVVPGEINYQGLLLDDLATPVTGNVDLVFSLFDVAAGGTAIWTETHPAVSVLDGVYNVVLGQTTPITPTLIGGGSLYLEISVDGETLTPRQRLTAVAYALTADTAENATNVGGVSSLFVTELFQNFSFDGSDPANDDPSEGFADVDGDGLANFLDPDNDDDGIDDGDELVAGSDINLVTPSITGFDPEPAAASATSLITVTGTNFEPGMSVTFGTETPTAQSVTATSFQVSVGPQPGGLATVTVTRTNGESGTADFLFVDSPSGLSGSSVGTCGNGSASSVTSCTIAYPAGVVAGDELLIWLGLDGSPADATCTNFERLTDQGGNVSLTVFRRRATGPHSGTEQCSWNAASPEAGGVIMTRVSGGGRLRPPLATLEGNSTTSDPPPVPIPSADALVVAACAHDGSVANVSDPPASYTEVLDGVGCDVNGCANISLATRVVNVAGSEDPGPFTNWNESEESACVTLAYDGALDPAPIFSVNWDGTSSPSSCLSEGATNESGPLDCNCTIGNCPLPQGGESLSMPAVATAQNMSVEFARPGGVMPGISDGCLTMDFELNIDTFSLSKNTSFIEMRSGPFLSGAEVRYLHAGDRLGIRCADSTLGSFGFLPAQDVDYRVRLEYCIDQGPGNCTGNPPGCTDCGCLYVETAASGNPWGTTQVDRCDGVGGAPFRPINGWQASMSADTLDLILDDVGICRTPPPAGGKCGD